MTSRDGAPSADDTEALTRAVREFRAAAEAVAGVTDHVIFRNFPSGCCKLASLLLARLLHDRGFGKAAYAWGDRATQPEKIDTHGWLCLGTLLIDVTGDQFADGPGPVFIAETSPWHSRFRSHGRFDYDGVMRFREGFARAFAALYEAIRGALPRGPAGHRGGDGTEDGGSASRPPSDVRLRLGAVTFRVVDHVGADQQLVAHAASAIAMVWQRHVGRPTEFLLEIADALRDADTGTDANGAYDPELHRVALAIGPGSECATLSQTAAKGHVMRVAAHEATHAVQCERAGGAAHFKGATPGDPAYNDHPTEVEAHHESVDVLKGYFPELRGALPMGGRTYPVPDESHYTDAWRGVIGGDTPVLVLDDPAAAEFPDGDAG